MNVGDKVICVDEEAANWMLRKGKTYVVHDVYEFPSGTPGVRVKGVDYGWYASRFELATPITKQDCM